jgi:hypothetical protein
MVSSLAVPSMETKGMFRFLRKSTIFMSAPTPMG